MGDMGDVWRAVRAAKKERRAKLGKDCPGCPKIQPKRIPTVLLPGQTCKVCGHTRSRNN